MKGNLSKALRSGLSLVLVLCILCGMVPVTAFAASTVGPAKSGVADVTGDGKITYVSFGDSVTNGYGMEGYRFEDGTNVLGFRREPKDSYPALIRDYLVGQGYKVNLEQMAISGFRMDELHWMLCDDYKPDSYHNYQFADWNTSAVRRLLNSTDPEAKVSASELRKKYQSQYSNDTGMINNADAIIMKEYRNAVENADLITIDLGTNNFGTFVTNTIQHILGLKKLRYTIDFTQYVDAKTAASLEGMLGQMVANMVNNGVVPPVINDKGETGNLAYDLTMTLARCLMYGYLGFTEHYDGAIEAIYEINPDAKVIVIDCYTMITGVDLTGGALGENIDLDQLYDMFIDLANFYSRELSPYANKVTHATLDSAPKLFIDSYANYEADKAAKKYPAEQQYLNESAYRLLNEFVMEMTGWDPDEPAHRATFDETVLANIQLLDSYVNNLKATVQEQVIDGQIMPQIKELVGELEEQIDTTVTAIELIYTAVDGVKTAEDMLPTALEGVKTARAAVDEAVAGVETAKSAVNTAVKGVNTATEAVDTAIDGVATAEPLVEIVVRDVVGNSMFSTSSLMKEIVLSVIKSKVSAMDLSEYGFSNDNETVSMLSEEIYDVACLYENEEKANGAEAAKKAVTIEIVRFYLVEVKGYTADEAQKTANLAYELNTIYKTKGKTATIKAAIASQITNEMLEEFGMTGKTPAEAAELVYTLGTSETVTAVKAAIASQVTEEQLGKFGLTDTTPAEAAELIYTLGTSDQKTAVLTAMRLVVDQQTAEAGYAMVEAYEKAGSDEAAKKAAAIQAGVAAFLTKENMAALDQFGIKDRATAAGLVCQVASLYNANLDTDSDKKAVVVCLVTLAETLKIEGIDEKTAATGYDLYAGAYKPAIQAGKPEQEAKALAAVAAIKTQPQFKETEGLAEAVYAIYKGNATPEQEQLAYISLMVGVAKIPQNVAEAVYACYADDLDGEFNDKKVKTVMIFFMSQLKDDEDKQLIEEPEESYKQYLMYKNVPATLSKIANCDTIYFDALLAATAGGELNLDQIAKKFQEGTLVLDKPEKSEEDDPTAWAAYKSDSALATLYFRFMSQDGVFTHPNEAGQLTLFNAVKKVLNSMLTAEPDSEIIITPNTNMLILGDFIAANENSYVKALCDNLGLAATGVNNLSNADFRINDVRALLDENYARDEYSEEVLKNVNADYKKAVKDSDVILLNVGSMNMGLIAKQLGVYMNSSTQGQTYSMEFTDIDSMQIQNLGAAMDGFLKNFSGAFGADAIGALMLAFETYGYGYTTFADCLDSTVETIQELNPEADIVLVGMYDLLGDAYIYESESKMYLELGHFVGHAVNLMNQHMITYAEMTDNVTYVDVTGTKTEMNTAAAYNMMAGGVAGITAAFGQATPTVEGYTYMANKILCGIGAHTPEKKEDMQWTWHEDNTATVAFKCSVCAEEVTVHAYVEEAGSHATCEQSGEVTYTASVTLGGERYSADPRTVHEKALGHDYESVVTDPTCTTEGYTTHTCIRDNCKHTYTDAVVKATGHNYKVTWSWLENYSAATATFNCGDCKDEQVLNAEITSNTTNPTCTTDGYVTLTASVEFEGKTYTDTQKQPGTVAGHTYGAPKAWTWAEDYSKAEAVFECSVCEEDTEGHDNTMEAVVTSEITKKPTCVDDGVKTHTAVLEGTEYRDVQEEILPATTDVHAYGKDHICEHCEKMDPAFFGGCDYRVEATLASGKTYALTLGGTNVGTYTFTQVSGGWAIQNKDGKYLALSNNTLTTSASAFAWTYSDGRFSAKGTSSSNGWLSGILGGLGNWWGSGSSNTTYYLVASGSNVSVSTTNSGTQAAFYIENSDEMHTFGKGTVTAPTCTEQGYTTYTCENCGYTYTDSLKPATGHTYKSVVTEPTCTEQGYTTHTCDGCGNSYVDSYVEAKNHDMKDGVCGVCGYTEGGECVYLTEKSLTSGDTLVLTLGGTNVGTYTFTQVSGGWAIRNEDGNYLALSNNTLTTSASSFAWTYSNGRFSATSTSSSGSSNNWWNNIFGGLWGSGSSSTTYYLVASGSKVSVSTSNSGAQAAFYIENINTKHAFDKGVVTEPTCTKQGYTTYTCADCGYAYTGTLKPATGHNHKSVVTEPTCTEQGYTTHTCDGCGDSYVDSYVVAKGHNMKDGVCSVCGHSEGSTAPEVPPVEPEDGECVYLAEKSLTSGNTYALTLGGTNVGNYTFTQVSGGWVIQNKDGNYLALSNNTLTTSASSFTWTYSNGRFSAKNTSSSGSSNNWWNSIFGGLWGSGSSSTTYYLVASGNNVAVSTSTSSASAKFYQQMTGTHAYGAPVAQNGTHVSTCSNCGNVKTEQCGNPDCELCNPAATIDVSVVITSKSSGSSGNSWLSGIFGNWWGSGSSTNKTYTATISVKADGTDVKSVAYSTNGGNSWTTGTSFTSSSEITAFDIRVEATNGLTYYFEYSNGKVVQVD